MRFVSKSLEDTERFVGEFVSKLEIKSSQATVLLLAGDLGSGKTTFTQVLARKLGVKENLTSPTFVLMKKYKVNHSLFHQLVHIDAYRLNSGQDLLNLGWGTLVSEPTNLIVVEWPEKVGSLWGNQEKKLNFKFIDEKTREISN